ncbi:MAG: type II toxin-antitoxin system VapC family toxin [Chloroflexota bacterium]|nr:MAG: VapC toxin family PIN domain ribonuclease [Chloroflexota bacterium]
MRIYVDSSALLKRVFDERGSDALRSTMDAYAHDGSVLVSSSLAWIEVSRALRARLAGSDDTVVEKWSVTALSGILERPINADIVALARRLGPPILRTLDAIHMASALLTDVGVMIVYDLRLLDAARHHGLTSVSPGARMDALNS